MKHTKLLSILCAIVATAVSAQTPNYHPISSQPERTAAALLGTDIFAVYVPGMDFVKVSSLVTYFNANLGFIPINSVISGSTWQGNVVSSTYGGTGWNSGASTGFAYVSGGTWSAVTTLTLSTPFTAPHLIGNSGVPTKAAGTGAGTSPTITLDANANDMSGTLTVLTGTSPAVSATVVTLTFATAYATAPHITLTAHSATAANLTTNAVWADSTTTTLLVKSTAVALTAATTYVWFYTVQQ